MGRVLIGTSFAAVSAVLALGCGSSQGSAGEAAPPAGPASVAQVPGEGAGAEGGITVVGEGSTQVTSDQATVVLGVEVAAESVSVAFSDANAAAQSVIQALRDAGVPDEDIRTVELLVRERREEPVRPVEGRPEITGYTVTNLVEVTIDGVDQASAVIDAAVEAGGDATRVRGFQLGVDQDEAALDEARAAAFEDARQRAERYAELAGRELGSLVSLSEIVGGAGPGPVTDAAGQEAAPPIEPGQQAVSVRIQATWSLG